jgi:hypothetical protein
MVHGLPAAAVMVRFTEQILAVPAHNITPQTGIIERVGRSETGGLELPCRITPY